MGYILIVFFILISPNVNAIQDVNLTIDSSGLDLCITADGLQKQVCDINHTVSLDGTQDHFIYITPKILIGTNQTQNAWNIVYHPIVYLFTGNGLYVILFILMVMYLFIRLVVRG